MLYSTAMTYHGLFTTLSTRWCCCFLRLPLRAPSPSALRVGPSLGAVGLNLELAEFGAESEKVPARLRRAALAPPAPAPAPAPASAPASAPTPAPAIAPAAGALRFTCAIFPAFPERAVPDGLGSVRVSPVSAPVPAPAAAPNACMFTRIAPGSPVVGCRDPEAVVVDEDDKPSAV